MISSLTYRQKQLDGIRRFLTECESDIYSSLYQDLRKPEMEVLFTEIAVTSAELSYAQKNLSHWITPKAVSVPLNLRPGKARVYPQPVGRVLIISPWNYPIQLNLIPLIGAIAAGNRVVIKPSELSPASSSLLAKKLPEYIDPDCLTIVEGDASVTKVLLLEKFDHIFFTGSSKVGKQVMLAAAKHLTPVTLELGGKSPCIVDESANLDVAARRIVWGKFLNAGQSCVAPDYLLVHESVENDLIGRIKKAIINFFGENPASSPDYGRIINLQHYNRLIALLSAGGEVVVGGDACKENLYISPTVIRNISLASDLFTGEIFGPILPIVRFSQLDDAMSFIRERPVPLAIYLFSQKANIKDKITSDTQSGSICINHVMLQLGVPELPFSGLGHSGMGSYHGKASFDTFSHFKSVFEKPICFDWDILYPPYGARLKKILRWIVK